MIGPLLHVGAKVGALVDGQLPPAEAERMWAHVHVCPSCRAAVAREGWVKTRLAGLALTPEQPAAPGHLAGTLSRVTALGWPEPVETGHDRRRLVLAAIGVGSVGAAFLGVFAVTVPAQAPGGPLPTTSLSRPSESSSSTPRSPGTTEARATRPLRVGSATAAHLAVPQSK